MMQAFWQAAKLGNFTRAAENCFMTQPAFSRLMSRFEKEMGVRLFERTTRHVTLTPEGVICLKRIDEILEAYDQMRTELEEAQSAVVTELHVGYNPVSGPPEFFVQALRQLQKAYPHVRVTIVRTYSHQQTGEKFGDYLLKKRMKEAARLLVRSSMRIQEIAVRVGYSTANSFSRSFRQFYGMTPKEYRLRRGENSDE